MSRLRGACGFYPRLVFCPQTAFRVSYRNQKLLIIGGQFDAMIYNFDINLNKNDEIYKIGLSYDQTVSRMRTNTNGTIEISFIISSIFTLLNPLPNILEELIITDSFVFISLSLIPSVNLEAIFF